MSVILNEPNPISGIYYSEKWKQKVANAFDCVCEVRSPALSCDPRRKHSNAHVKWAACAQQHKYNTLIAQKWMYTCRKQITTVNECGKK